MLAENHLKSIIIADAHVHINNCFDLEKMLDSALDNFGQISQKQGYKNNYHGILFLTETTNQNWFNQLAQEKQKVNNWTFQNTPEKVSLFAQNALNQKLLLIAGRQIVTAENLEVLALITEQNFIDGLSLKATMQAIVAAGGIPVIPWGVGKWFGHRGKIISNLFNNSELPPFFLGDNSGRPFFWLRSPYFQQAKTKGIKILPGTDPLPLRSEVSRPGSFGFKIRAELNLRQPGTHLKQMLLDQNLMIEPYGSLETPFRFIRNQLLIRI